MKVFTLTLIIAFVIGWSGSALAGSNPLAIGVEKTTKAPFTMLKNGNEHLFTPVKEINHTVFDFTDNARAATVSVGLNWGYPVEE